MKKILSLDLGITTGFAVHTMDKGLVTYGEIAENTFFDEVRLLMLGHLISYSVVERPVIVRGPLGERLENLLSQCRVVLDHQADYVDPARWKSTPAKKHPTPRGTSTHVKDAIRLGVWYIGNLSGRL
jgi:hypothetical protein